MTNVLTNWRSYRRTLAELRALSPRALADLDLRRDDLKNAARRSVYAG